MLLASLTYFPDRTDHGACEQKLNTLPFSATGHPAGGLFRNPFPVLPNN
jgi:hypothetical protein